ncbi:MAG TPA: ROK family protein [Candidatus Saccharimonadales bacterium]|nr:ROK family protein [Candidatus Saccharimonadales bacterium]
MITAVDIGATKTLVAQFNTSLQPINEVRFETAKDQVDFFHDLMEQLNRLDNISTLAVGVPGILDSKGIILRCANLPWQNFDLKRVLFQHFRCPVLIDNDARLAGLAEINAVKPLPALGLYLTVSTGIGGGVVVNGRIVDELKSEPGHMLFEFQDVWQEWEDFASGSAIREHFGMYAKELTTTDQWQEVAKRLTIGLAALIPALQPTVIVFGGGVGQYSNKFAPFVVEQLKQQLPSYIKIPAIINAQHPQEAVLYGCYHYAKHRQDSFVS